MESQSQSGDGVPLSTDVQDLVYGSHIRRDLKLMEVPVALLKEILENGVDVKAASTTGYAYLCTQDCTYAIKTNDNTHHVALVDPSQTGDKQVVLSALTAGRFELVEDVSSIDRVYEMLRERPYDGEDDIPMSSEFDPISESNVYTFDDLYEKSQVSFGEIKGVLKDLAAFQINGCWRVFGHHYLNKMVDQIVSRSILQGWDMSSIPIGDLEKMMANEGHSIAAVRSCISLLGKSTREGDMDDLWEIDDQKLCIHFAKRLLARKTWVVDEFMEEWSRGLPFGLKPSKEMLLGEAVVNEAQSIIKGFCKDDLPKECRARVKAVFSEKDLWNPDELRKYLCDAKFPGDWSLDVALLELCQKCKFRLSDPDMYCIRSSAFTGG